MGQIDSPNWLGFEESFSFFPLKGKQLFSLVQFKFPTYGVVPVLDKCHCITECSEDLNFLTLKDEIYCWPLPGLIGVLRNIGCFI